MIDVIIPCYNAYDTIDRTLHSIIYQSIKDKIKVYLIDDASDKPYDYLIDRYGKYLDINIIKVNVNGGAGIAREIAINRTMSRYIVFIDSDDYFYNSDALEVLFNKIEEGYDYVSSRELDEKKNRIIALNGDLHGKIYRRSFLTKNNIHFNNTRYHEDNYFNNIVRLSTKNNYLIDDYCSYYYSYNKKSITNKDDKEFERIEIYLKNMKDILDGASEHKYITKKLYLFKCEKYNYINVLFKKANAKEKKQLTEWLHMYDENYFNYMGLDKEELFKAIYVREFLNKIDFEDE